MSQFTDQTGYTVDLTNQPKRIVSLVPSQSEFLWDLGIRNELIGITKFCIRPQQMYQTVTRVGGTKELDLDKIRSLKPDLIIGNKEENSQEQIEQLRKEFAVWMSDIYTIGDALEMMKQLALMLQKSTEAETIISQIKISLAPIENSFQKKSVLYLMWYKPYMAAASNTFIDAVLRHVGLINVLGNKSRYPVLEIQEIQKLNPEYCLLSSEPYPFKEKHIQELQRLLPQSKIVFVDGELFSWYGSRLIQLGNYIQQLKQRLIV